MKTVFMFVIMLATMAGCDHLHHIDTMLTAAQHLALTDAGYVFSAGDSGPLAGTDTTVTDGGFENWSDASHLVNWTIKLPSIAQESTYKYSGNYSVHLNSNAAITQNISPLVAGKTYLITVWAKTGGDHAMFRIDGPGAAVTFSYTFPVNATALYTFSYTGQGSETAIELMNASIDTYFDALSIQPQGGGETLTYQNRWYRQTQASTLTISADMNDTHVPSDAKNLITDSIVSAFPASIGTSPESLYQQANEIVVYPGYPITMQCNYTDPVAGLGSASKVRMVTGTGIAPVSGTDYKASFTQGGESANDATGSLTVAVTWYAAYASVVLTNNSSQNIFVLPFNLRGTIIRLYNQMDVRVTDTTTALAKYGDIVLQYSMPYQSSQSVATDMANHWLSTWHNPVALPEHHEYYANRNATMATGAVTLDIGNRYTATEPVTGINKDYNIMGIDITISAASGGNPTVLMRYYPEPTNLVANFILDDAVYGVLDTGPGVLGF